MNRKHGSKKAQAWSVDLIIGVVVFLLLIVILYSLLANQPVKDTTLRQQADNVYARLDVKTTSGDYGADPTLPKIIVANSINNSAINKLYIYATGYDDLRQKLGINGDFCIVMVDDEGAIVPTYDSNGVPRFSQGNVNDNLYISDGIVCGQ